MKDIKTLNEYGKKSRQQSSMGIPADKADQYLKETFGLSDQDLKDLENGTYKLPPMSEWGEPPVFEYNFIPNRNSRQK